MSEEVHPIGTLKCRIDGCQHPRAAPQYRGLCLPCYSVAKGKVTSGATTWDELVSLGLALPTGDDPFSRAFGAVKK